MKIVILIVFFSLKFRHICFLFYNSLKDSPYFLNLQIFHKFQMWIWTQKTAVSSIAGRYCCIAVTGYIASKEKATAAYVPSFYFLCALFRVYQLAYIATPNLFPIF